MGRWAIVRDPHRRSVARELHLCLGDDALQMQPPTHVQRMRRSAYGGGELPAQGGECISINDGCAVDLQDTALSEQLDAGSVWVDCGGRGQRRLARTTGVVVEQQAEPAK